MTRRDFITTTAALGLTGCTRPSAPAALREVSVSLAEHLSVAPFFLADELGLFGQAGFRIKRVRMSALDVIPVLAGGKLDIAFGGVAAPLMEAVANQMAIRVVAGRDAAVPDCGESFSLYVNRSVLGNGPVDFQKLRGRRICVRMRGISEFMLDTFLKLKGIPPKSVTRVDLPLGEALAALAANRIDAMLDQNLARSPMLASGQLVKVWSYADAQPGHQYSFVIFGKSMLDDAPGASRFLAAYLEGSRRFLAGETPKFMTDFAKTYGLNVDETVKACRATFPRDGAVDLPSLERIFAWNFERGYATTPLKVAQLVDTRYTVDAGRMLADQSWRIHPAKKGAS